MNVRIEKIHEVPELPASEIKQYWASYLGDRVSIMGWPDIPDSLRFLTSCREVGNDGRSRKLTLTRISKRLGIHRNSLHHYLRGGTCSSLPVRLSINSWAAMLREQMKNKNVIVREEV